MTARFSPEAFRILKATSLEFVQLVLDFLPGQTLPDAGGGLRRRRARADGFRVQHKSLAAGIRFISAVRG
jgi:hypothetical protein